MPKSKFCLVLLAAVLLHLPAHAAKIKPEEDKVWVVVKPLQCMDNPWESDWLAHHKKKVAKYPRKEEHAIIKQFFQKKGVKIWDIRVKAYVKGDPLCMTCGCQRGDTLFLLVYASDSPKMKSYGFGKRLPVRKK